MEHNSLNPWYLAAAVLMAFTTLVHVFAGGPEIYAPVRNNNSLTPELSSVLSVVWHVVTSQLALMTLALLWLARRPNPALAMILVMMAFAYVALFIGYGFADLGNVTAMPQWTLFLALCALILLGQRSKT